MDDGHGTVRIRLCGAVAVSTPGRTLSGRDLGSRKARTLLAVLAAERGGLVPLDRIVEAVWPDGGPADPAANVATLVSRLRRALGPDVLAGSGRAYGLAQPGRWRVDLDEAARWCVEAEARITANEPVLATAASRAALDLLGSQPALADEGDGAWVQAVRREADTSRRRARHTLTESLPPVEGAAVAAEAVLADGYDEQAVRDLMRTLAADGRTSAALAAYDDLARRLRDDLGTAPDRATADLHLAVLRETALPAEDREPGDRSRPPALLGREPELAAAEEAWTAVGSSEDRHLLLVEGEAGIGKTRLLEAVADLAAATGGRVLRGRCHPAERSLFLQPYVDALRPTLLAAPAPVLADLVRDHEDAWLALLPDLAPVLPGGTTLPTDVELLRRRAYDAVVAVLRRLALDRPVLLTIDDLQDGGAATVELLGYLAGHLGRSRLLVAAAVRAEDAAIIRPLVDRAIPLPLGALPRSAVDALAAAAGLADLGDQVMARTAGHPLSVVESLRALAGGDHGVPVTLADAVLSRVGRLDETDRALLDAAAVLRRRLDPALLARLTETSELAVVRGCELLVRQRLLARSGSHYEFANDLLQECVHDALPPALARAHHRRAADLTTDRPEVMAEHAHAAGDEARAAHGWLLAGEAALRRSAVEDALGLLDRALAVGTASEATRARALLARSAVHEAGTDYDAALADIDAALVLCRHGGDRRLEMRALRARGGDPAIGLRLPADELATPLEAGLRLAGDLGDRRAVTDFTTRLAVLDASRLRLATALDRAERGVVRARAAGSEDSVMVALDGLKTVLSYLGDGPRLRAVVDELEPMVRAREDTWLLQWVVFESSFAAAAEGRHGDARTLVAKALELNRRSGFPAYAGYLRAYDAWFARLDGDLETARRIGRDALAATSPVRHPWWYATAAGLLAATLLETGDTAEAEAAARRGLAETAPGTVDAGRLRCWAALAAATGHEDDLATARAMLDAVECPPGGAWVAGADVYLLLHRTAQLGVATADSWPALRAQITSSTSSAARAAPPAGTGR